MGLMVWSPLASGLLSGKYRPRQEGGAIGGRVVTLKGTINPGFQKLTPRNFAIVAELETVAKEVDRSMAQVALNWVANRPGVASTIVGAAKLTQLEDNLLALNLAPPATLTARLDKASAPKRVFPYLFFDAAIQGVVRGGVTVGAKPESYQRVKISSAGAGVTA
jgi:aryl-alcohol dehydrogenase-like predicted oxidoreductase